MTNLDAHFEGPDGGHAGEADSLERGARRLHAADLTVTAFLFALCVSIVVNALALQARPAGELSPLPPHRPAAASQMPASQGGTAQGAVAHGQTAQESTSAPKPSVAHASAAPAPTGGMTEGTLGYLVARTLTLDTPAPAPSHPSANYGAEPEVTGAVRPPVDVPESSRVLAVQRTLSRLGYGPLKVDGQAGSQTRLAIERFQHDRNLPADGQISDRLVRELSAVSGQAVD